MGINHQSFMRVAYEIASNSKDPSSKVGAVIVDQNKRIISTGYNGMVAGCDELLMSWERPIKYSLVVHAEMNALLYAKNDLSSCTLYTTHGPCANCLKHALQAGIRRIYYDNPGIVRDRGTKEEKEAIHRLMISTGAVVENLNNNEDYLKEIISDGQ